MSGLNLIACSPSGPFPPEEKEGAWKKGRGRLDRWRLARVGAAAAMKGSGVETTGERAGALRVGVVCGAEMTGRSAHVGRWHGSNRAGTPVR